MTSPAASGTRGAARIRGRRVWPWVVATLSFATFVTMLLVERQSEEPVEAILTLVLYPAAVGALLFVGALLVQRVPDNVVGWLLLAAGLTMCAAVTCGLYASLAWSQPGEPWPGAVLAAVANQVLFIYPLVLTLVVVPLYFPTGRLPGPRWRWAVWLAAAALAATTISDLVRPTTLVADIPNPLGTEALLPLADALTAFTSLSSVAGFGAAAAALLVRFRRARGVERQQLKWLLAVAGLGAVILPASFLVPDEDLANALFVLDLLLFVALPVTIGFAILRYRLYEIDRIVSRTIGWAIVTGVLVTVFAVAVVGLQTLLAPVTSTSTLAVAGSTLLAAALFQPLRSRIQRAVDRRFHRARYDGERIAAAFGARLRDQVDLDHLTDEVDQVARETVRPVTAGVWLRNATNRRPAATP